MTNLDSMTAVPLPSISSWAQAANVCGFALDPILREAGISGKTSSPVSPFSLHKALQLCVERSTGRYFPFVLGNSFVFEAFNEFETFINSASTLREALEVASWAHDLIAPWMTLRLDEFGAEAHVRVELPFPGGHLPLFASVREVILAVVFQLIRRVTQQSSWLISVRLSQPRPEGRQPQEFESHFGVPVSFNEGVDALVIDRRWLDAPLKGAVPDVMGQARQQIEKRLAAAVGGRRIVDDVRWALERRPELLREGLEATAAALGLHPRTLQRRLQTEGVRFVDIQSEAKLYRAKTMLRRRAMSMESISDELGFSDRRAFTFAFKRWTGLSPSAFRNQLASNNGNSAAAA
ncbi:MAG: AraC family transcriptional regulator ligand-binding domain-containing protein [Burkholderiales bacterium]|nr:AraC family transcriptional regulator ligand-binding domain-containing protein [Burkholderiales bacterium]